MLSGIAAHCDPSFCGDLGCEVSVSSPESTCQTEPRNSCQPSSPALLRAPLATISHGATPAADDCLAGPKDQAPQGGHWYYRIEHATNRHCWYLKDEHDKLSQIAPPNSSPSATPIAPNAETADAALDRGRPRRTAAAAGSADQMRHRGTGSAAPANAPATQRTAGPRRCEHAAIGRRFALARSIERRVRRPVPAPATRPIRALPRHRIQRRRRPPPSPRCRSPRRTHRPTKQSGSIQMLLLAIVGALSLAGLMGSAIFRFGGTRDGSAEREIQVDRHAIWDSAAPIVDRRRSSRMRARACGDDIPRELRTADDPNRRIAEMLAQLARSATA